MASSAPWICKELRISTQHRGCKGWGKHQLLENKEKSLHCSKCLETISERQERCSPWVMRDLTREEAALEPCDSARPAVPFLHSERSPQQMDTFVKPSLGCREPFRGRRQERICPLSIFLSLKTISAPVVKDLLAAVVNTVS